MSWYHQFQTAVTFANLSLSFEYPHKSLEQSCKVLVKKDFMRSILFKGVFKVLNYPFYISRYNNFYHLPNYTFFF